MVVHGKVHAHSFECHINKIGDVHVGYFKRDEWLCMLKMHAHATCNEKIM